jgi:tetratricopeptide (TPR) repeat protein
MLGDDLGDFFTPHVVDYLNITGSPAGLEDAIIVSSDPEQPMVTVQSFEADITGDGESNLLVSVTSRWGGVYNNLIAVYACSDGMYITLGILSFSDFFNFSDDPPTTIVAVTDMNNNQRPEIVQRRGGAVQKFEEIIDIFEWNDGEMVQTFSTDYSYGAFNSVDVMDVDEVADTLELVVGDGWGYGQATALSINEIVRWRPIERTYAWDGDTYAEICHVFNDSPTTRFETLHSAETQWACGDYDTAMANYQALLDNDEWESWPWTIGLDLSDVDDVEAYVSELESAYLRAFAYYRIVQLQLIDDNVDAALETLDAAQTDYVIGQQGYQYVAMTAALVEAFEETDDLAAACVEAEMVYEQVRENGDDPGIAYAPPEEYAGTSFQFPFYWDSGKVNSSNPDDMFNAPPDIADMLSFPICIQ